jgi:hypothetical protein
MSQNLWLSSISLADVFSDMRANVPIRMRAGVRMSALVDSSDQREK